MNLTDTHSHIYAEEFDADRREVILRAQQVGVRRILLPAVDTESHERLFAVCREYPGMCVPMMGLHPTSVNDNPRWREELAEVAAHLAAPSAGAFCAVGEIGLDLYWSRAFRAEQEEAFRFQLDRALQHELPVVMHVRDAWPQTLALLREYAGRGLRGVFHAFSGTAEDCSALKECGDFVFGIGGVVTFKKSSLADTVHGMNLSDMVLETDSPYLTPAPHRGQRNEPAYVALVCRKIAEIKGVDVQQVAEATTANASRIFGMEFFEECIF